MKKEMMNKVNGIAENVFFLMKRDTEEERKVYTAISDMINQVMEYLDIEGENISEYTRNLFERLQRYYNVLIKAGMFLEKVA